MPQSFLTSLIALVFSLSACAQDWSQLTAEAQRRFEAGQYADGERIARQALRAAETKIPIDEEEVAASLNNLAEFARARKRPNDAAQLIERSLAITARIFGINDPAFAAVLSGKAALARDLGRRADAQRLYEQCLRIDEAALGPDDPAVARDLNNLAALYSSSGRAAEAEPLARRALRIAEAALGPASSMTAVCLRGLASIRAVQGDPNEAGELLTRAVVILSASLGASHPETAAAKRELAGLAPAATLARLEAGARAKPQDAAARYRLGVAYDRKKRYADARREFEAAVALQPSMREAWEYLALIYETEQDAAKAEAAYRNALAGATTEWPSLNYGIFLSKLHRYSEAIEWLGRAAELAPDSGKVQYELGRVLLQTGDPAAARDALVRASHLAPGLALVHYFLGQAHQRLGQPDLAAKSFARFRELDKSGPR